MLHCVIEYLIGKIMKSATVTCLEEYPTICLKTLRKCKKNSSRQLILLSRFNPPTKKMLNMK